MSGRNLGPKLRDIPIALTLGCVFVATMIAFNWPGWVLMPEILVAATVWAVIEVALEDEREVIPTTPPSARTFFEAVRAIENSARFVARPIKARGRGWALRWDFEKHGVSPYHPGPAREESSLRWLFRQMREMTWLFGEWELLPLLAFEREACCPHEVLAHGDAVDDEADDVAVASTEGDVP